MNGRRTVWLLGALLLFGFAGWLMSRGDVPEKQEERRTVQFARHLDSDDFARRKARSALLLPALPTPPNADPDEPPPQRRDPVLAILPRGPGASAAVFEANAFRHSPVGELLVDCMSPRAKRSLEKLKRDHGFDPLEDVDRIVAMRDGVAFSGNFSDGLFKQVASQAKRTATLGKEGRLYVVDGPGGRGQDGKEPEPMYLGVWRNQMAMVGSSEQGVAEAIRRLEGDGSEGPAVLGEEETYGEAYGSVAASDLVELMGKGDDPLSKELLAAAQRVKFHLDTTSDLGVVADFEGSDSQKVTDLGKSVAGGLSLLRLNAKAKGEGVMADLLDTARVRPDGDHFRTEFGLPLSFFKERLAHCHDHDHLAESDDQEVSAPEAAPAVPEGEPAPAPAPAAAPH